MKHFFTFLVIGLLSISQVKAQESMCVLEAKLWTLDAAANQEILFKSGFTLSNVSNINENYKLSFHFGFATEFKISKLYAIQPEVVFSRQGSTANLDGIRTRNRLNYINIPVVSKFYITPKISLDIAPQLGLLASARLKIEDDLIKINNSKINKTEFAIGAGFTIDLLDDTLISFRYTQGMTNVYKKSQIGRNTRNSTFELSIIVRD